MPPGRSFAGNRPPTQSPTETAGFKWQPEICPMATAIVCTVGQNARETPGSPIPVSVNAVASAALPYPPRTSKIATVNSAVYSFL